MLDVSIWFNQQTRRQAAADLLLFHHLWHSRSNWPSSCYTFLSRKCETLTQFCPIIVASQQSPGKFPYFRSGYNLLYYLQWTRSPQTYVVEARKWCWHGPPHTVLARIKQLLSFISIFAWLPVHFLLYSVIWVIFACHLRKGFQGVYTFPEDGCTNCWLPPCANW